MMMMLADSLSQRQEHDRHLRTRTLFSSMQEHDMMLESHEVERHHELLADFGHQRHDEHEHVTSTLLRGHNSAIESSPSNPSTSYSWTEFQMFFSAACGDIDGVKVLLESGVSINARDYNHRSALHLAAERGHKELVEYLLSQGSDINCKGKEGETALTLAVGNNHYAIQQMLRKAGATQFVNSEPESVTNLMLASFAVIEAFPRPIALAILEGRKIERICKNCASLFVSDIVGFTSISSKLEVSKVSSLLSRLYSKFDRLAYLHGVQKVEVIGDAYVAATNLMESQDDDHAARLARFALDAILAARDTEIDLDDPTLGGVCIRVGLHSGPVCAEVVGAQSLRYTLMGDTLAMACRMETGGVPCRVHCSGASAALIAAQSHELVLRPRARHAAAAAAAAPAAAPGLGWLEPGKLEVSGVPVETYWVSSLRTGLRNFGSCPDLSNFDRPQSRRSSLDSHPLARTGSSNRLSAAGVRRGGAETRTAGEGSGSTGSLSASTGSLSASAGSLSASAGSLSASAGSLSASARPVSLATGEVRWGGALPRESGSDAGEACVHSVSLKERARASMLSALTNRSHVHRL